MANIQYNTCFHLLLRRSDEQTVCHERQSLPQW